MQTNLRAKEIKFSSDILNSEKNHFKRFNIYIYIHIV